MFFNGFLKSFRIFLLPFALVYWVIIAVRNWLFDKQILKSNSFGLPLICVGNLSVGGTGKSPMVEYLVRFLEKHTKPAILSRGYKRRTTGYLLAREGHNALHIGDEPMQFFQKFPNVPVAVGEKRLEAIPQLLHDHPETGCIILDDAFQHRSVTAGMNILLTDYNNLFTRDFYLPTGDLRDLKSGYKRAQIIVVTKCDPKITEETRQSIIREINPAPHQQVFFTANRYAHPYHLVRMDESIRLSVPEDILLITGIANPDPLKNLLEKHAMSYTMMHFSDHHDFSIADWRDINKKFEQLPGKNKIILTTEKDAVRLAKFREDIHQIPLYVIPLEHHFLFDQQTEFQEIVLKFIQNFRANT